MENSLFEALGFINILSLSKIQLLSTFIILILQITDLEDLPSQSSKGCKYISLLSMVEGLTVNSEEWLNLYYFNVR